MSPGASFLSADVVEWLAERAWAAAAAVWARVRLVVDAVLAAVDTVAVVYVMRGAFVRHHLLAEARRHLAYALRGRPHESGLDERIVQAAVDNRTRPVGRGRRMTADLRALYPGDTEDQAVLRPLTRSRTAAPYERARLAAGALAARAHAERLSSRSRPYAVAVPSASRSRLRPFRDGRKDGRLLEPETGADVDAVEQTRQTLEAAAAQHGRHHRPCRHIQGDGQLRVYRTAVLARLCRPQADGRRARRGPGARSRRARGVAADLEAAPNAEVEDGPEGGAARVTPTAPGRR